MHVLEPGEVASNDDQVHPPVMQHVEVLDWTACAFDPEGKRNGGSFRQETLGYEQGSIVIRHDEAGRGSTLAGISSSSSVRVGLMGGVISVVQRFLPPTRGRPRCARSLSEGRT
jgi:hypothetical protein